jgi:hypothetical protein
MTRCRKGKGQNADLPRGEIVTLNKIGSLDGFGCNQEAAWLRNADSELTNGFQKSFRNSTLAACQTGRRPEIR